MFISCKRKYPVKILIPADSTPREHLAATELQKYLKMIFDVSTDISDEMSDDRDCIIIGGPERNSSAAGFISTVEFDSLVPGPEGFMIKTFGNNVLLIAGSSKNPLERERGTLYAVYEFLERFCGCSFAAYGKTGTELGEYVPRMQDISLDKINYVKSSADLPYRTAIVQFYGDDDQDADTKPNHTLTLNLINWMAKNRLNRILTMINFYEDLKKSGLIEEIERRGISITAGHHDSSMFFMPPEKYFQTHPEYYRLKNDGSRFQPTSKWSGQLIFDSRSAGCIKQMAENIIDWFRINPYVDIVNIWPNDGDDPQCACSECSKFSKTTNYAYFVSEISKAVNIEFPDKKIDMIVYLDLWDPPENITLAGGVFIEESTWGPQYILRKFGAADGSGIIGTGIEENAMKWSKLADGMVYYDYYMTNFSSKQVYCPMADEIIGLYENFVRSGYCKGSGTQMESYNLWNYLFNFYVHGRKAYDTSLSMDDLLNRFTRIFGKGAGFIGDYIKYIENFWEGQVPEGKHGTDCAAHFASTVDRIKVYDLFEKALDAESDPKLRSNIMLLRMAFRYSDLHTNEPQSDELTYLSARFGSYWGNLGQTGYGISVYEKPSESNFADTKWYEVAGNPEGIFPRTL